MNSLHDPDQELVARAAAGDRRAFGDLLGRHYDRMYRVAWRMTGSTHDAEDIVQDVCCDLVSRIGGFRGEARFTTWLTGIVLNACRDHRRRRSVLERIKEGFSNVASLARPPDGRDLYRSIWLAAEISRLEPSLREALVLVAGEGMTHAEAARLLGVAESTVSWRLHEIRKRLRSGLDEEAAYGA